LKWIGYKYLICHFFLIILNLEYKKPERGAGSGDVTVTLSPDREMQEERINISADWNGRRNGKWQ